jgi:hypothetical protein
MAGLEKSAPMELMYGPSVPFERIRIGNTYVITVFEDSTKTRVRNHQGRSLEFFRGKVIETFENGNPPQQRVMFELLEIFPRTNLALPFNLLEFRTLEKDIALTHGGRKSRRRGRKHRKLRKTRR